MTRQSSATLLTLPFFPFDSSAPATQAPATTTAGTTPAVAATDKTAASKPTMASSTPTGNPAVTVPRTRDAEYRERARKMFESHGMTVEIHSWNVPGSEPLDRIEKAVRVRVRRHCHRCQAIFGQDKVCQECNHKRCTKCPRFPAKKAIAGTFGGDDVAVKKKSDGKVRGTTVLDDLNMLSNPTDGQVHKDGKQSRSKSGKDIADDPDEPFNDWVRSQNARTVKKPRQLVRYVCDGCDSQFENKGQPCVECHHLRCDNCKREP